MSLKELPFSLCIYFYTNVNMGLLKHGFPVAPNYLNILSLASQVLYLAYESESSSSNNGIGVRLLTVCFEDKENL